MSGAVMNYDFGPKRHWRRWVWNRIAERVDNPRDAVAVYLAGASDEDRPVARAKGFRDNNLIAVEKDPAAIEALRSRGVLTIGGDFFQAVDSLAISGLGARSGIQVISADLCGGLSAQAFVGVSQWLAYPCLQDCVFVVNLLRGRDSPTNPIRRFVADDLGKHRGQILIHWVLSDLASTGTLDESLTHRRYVELLKHAAPVYTSYRSTAHQTFDTVVFAHPLKNSAVRLAVDLPQLFRRHGMLADLSKVRRSASAVLAHRTMRGG